MTITTFAENELIRTPAATSPLAAYVCPRCKGALAVAAQELRCAACAHAYPVRNRIPDFLGVDLRHSASWSLRHARVFDWLAPIYETNLWYPVVMKLAGVKGVTTLPELLATVDAMVGTIPGDVLDVACGPGTFGRRVAAHSRSVFGIDISPGMLEQGCKYAERERVININFACARVEALPFAQQTFAAALCCGSLHLFPDAALALREIARTLQPGALLVGLTFTQTNTRFSRFAERHGGRLFDVQNLGSLLREVGFEDYSPSTFGSALLFSVRKKGI